MRLVLVSVAGVVSLALAGCGGSSNPTPTPTPTAIAYTTSETALQYTTEGGVQRVANTQFVAPAMGSVFGFTPAQNGYTYTLLNGTVNPSPSEAAVFTATSTKTCDVPALCFGNAFFFQEIPAGAGEYHLSRFITGAGNPLLVLSFAAFG